MRACFLPAVVVAVLIGPAAATAQTGGPADAPKKLVTKVFSVAELVVPVPDFDSRSAAPEKEKWKTPSAAEAGEQLIRLVAGTVRPCSWGAMGGPGKVEFHEIGFALVVTNTPEVVAEVGDFLAALKRMQDVTIVCELRVLRGPVGFCERVGLKPAGDQDAALTERELRALMEAAQADRQCTIHQFPKLSVADGQVATVRNGEQRDFVSSLEATTGKDGTVVLIPKVRTVDLGDTLTLCGRVSADEKAVALRVNLTRTRLIGEVELFPVTTQITPVFEGGSQGKPIPFTQFLEVPRLRTVSVERSVSVPTGATVVVGGWKEPAGDSQVIIQKVPFTGMRFRTTPPAADCEVVVLASVRVVREAGEAPIRQAPTSDRRR